MAIADIDVYLKLLPLVETTPHQSLRMFFDREADVLDITLKEGANVTNSILRDDDVLVSYEDQEIVGYTILFVSTRSL